jgi:hypothetical protein
MSNILHDARVAWWAWRTKHANRGALRIEIVWPISIRRSIPTDNGSWIVRFERPGLYVLNPYSVELDHMLAHTPDRSAK